MYRALKDKSIEELTEEWWRLRGKIDGPANDGRLTAGSSAQLDAWCDDLEAVETELKARGAPVPATPPESYLAEIDGGRHHVLFEIERLLGNDRHTPTLSTVEALKRVAEGKANEGDRALLASLRPPIPVTGP